MSQADSTDLRQSLEGLEDMVMQTAVASCKGDKMHSSTYTAQKSWEASGVLRLGLCMLLGCHKEGEFQICKTSLSSYEQQP